MSSTDRDLLVLHERSARAYVKALREMMEAVAIGDGVALARSREVLEDVIGSTMGEAEALGALQTLQEAAEAYEKAAPEAVPEPAMTEPVERRLSIVFARPATGTSVPRVQFMERLRDLITRAPTTLKRAAERTAAGIAALYAKGRVIAFARSAEQAVTERAQALLVDAVKRGLVEREAGTLIKLGVNEIAKETADWTEAYARMAFRTNVNTATAAGRFRQMDDPAVKVVMPAFKFVSMKDADTRDNHEAMHGVILSRDNPAWARLAPPLGYNCRCTLAFVSTYTLHKMGRLNPDGSVREDVIPSGAGPDPGFRHVGRPDLFIKGAVT